MFIIDSTSIDSRRYISIPNPRPGPIDEFEQTNLALKEKTEVVAVKQNGTKYSIQIIEDKDDEDPCRELFRCYAYSVEGPSRVFNRLDKRLSKGQEQILEFPDRYHLDRCYQLFQLVVKFDFNEMEVFAEVLSNDANSSSNRALGTELRNELKPLPGKW